MHKCLGYLLISFSGKALVSIQRQTAYQKHHGRQGSSHLCILPAALITEALDVVPEGSTLFQQALAGPDVLDETGLDAWDSGPPYATGPPSNSAREVEHTRRLTEVMHGRRARMLRDNPWGGDMNAWRLRVEEIVEQWRIAEVFLTSYDDGHRELVMARLWKQWLARVAYHYNQKLRHVK